MTISNVGMFRTDLSIPIIHPGKAAMLGIGTLAERPAVVARGLAVRQTMPMTLCVDHRIADGEGGLEISRCRGRRSRITEMNLPADRGRYVPPRPLTKAS